ncbi:DNA endonuclease RBBP8 isoform X2 [Dunckerocampus dactyliophorus]|uniref:DNA endonuclease RBBP8 isoform X2 n=1 Tax=Dunckerocampus dactyliophorus TaxID=161453 RepID=UPI0024053D09|nr:DNA endonuclease RBBP8 isoform X2 [Dunckerocampus dactyliophorus]
MTTEVDRMSSLTSTPKADPFHALWKQLWECHQTGLQELEEKVSKLKKERNLDAQRLEVFYTRNQELKEQNKGLRDAISLLEDRLRAGECDRCSVLEENLKSSQHQREQIINKLKHERKCLEDENGKLCAELQKLKRCAEPQVAVAAEQEDGIIPDSPVLASSLPPAKKLKKRKNPDKSKHVHYTEEPSFINKSLFKDVSNELVGASKNAPRVEVLVPNTCEIDASQIGGEEENGGEVIAETCALELVDICHMETPEAPSQQSASKSSRLYDVRQKPCHTSSSHLLVIHTHATTEKSPSLLLRGKRLTRSDSICREKWKKEDGEPKEQMPKAELVDPTCRTLSTQSFKQPPDSKVETPSVDCGIPAFKKPNSKLLEHRWSHLHGHNAAHGQTQPCDERTQRVENMWSIDPALTFSLYESERGADEHEEHGEPLDSDCTWVSHSLLQGRRESDPDEEHGVSGIGEKANDSLDGMFDTTAHEEYVSYNRSQVASEDVKEEEQQEDEQEPSEDYPRVHKAKHPTFAHVAVVRKKDERRKLKGTTCKECEVYYAHLPEEEKEKKLSECSRHRHRFIPPSTPEHFWEVGFPSTQTCIERGYIREEKTPSARLRRKQPFTALFSPKSSQKDS